MAYYTWKSYKCKPQPLEIFSLFSKSPYCFFLDSSLDRETPAGRYSFIGADPYYVLEARDYRQLRALDTMLIDNRMSAEAVPAPFLCGAVGYIGYDAGFWFEPRLKKNKDDDVGIPPALFCFYNTIIAVDHLRGLMHIIAVGAPEKRRGAAVKLCERNIARFQRILRRYDGRGRPAVSHLSPASPEQARSSFDRESFCRCLRQAKEYIAAGDIYQVNLSQRFQGHSAVDALTLYRRLRAASPSNFGGFFDAGDFQIISSSPEEFLRVRDNRISTRPMKGTRPRGRAMREDLLLKKRLMESAKDRAELLMIVDLLRNDLGKVCTYGSIEVPSLRELETYSTVYQTTATVEGTLEKNIRISDILKACFPGGSITGCPKLRAVEIIEELEPCRRSIYTGCFGYLSFCGNLDMNILIRTILKKKRRFYFGVGAGIVADSQPALEYDETLIKARAMMEALGVRYENSCLPQREVCRL